MGRSRIYLLEDSEQAVRVRAVRARRLRSLRNVYKASVLKDAADRVPSTYPGLIMRHSTTTTREPEDVVRVRRESRAAPPSGILGIPEELTDRSLVRVQAVSCAARKGSVATNVRAIYSSDIRPARGTLECWDRVSAQATNHGDLLVSGRHAPSRGAYASTIRKR